jgi:hypothetical protein
MTFRELGHADLRSWRGRLQALSQFDRPECDHRLAASIGAGDPGHARRIVPAGQSGQKIVGQKRRIGGCTQQMAGAAFSGRCHQRVEPGKRAAKTVNAVGDDIKAELIEAIWFAIGVDHHFAGLCHQRADHMGNQGFACQFGKGFVGAFHAQAAAAGKNAADNDHRASPVIVLSAGARLRSTLIT